MIVVGPPETAVTNPVASTVATAGFEETQGFIGAGIPNPVNCVVVEPGRQILVKPVITPKGEEEKILFNLFSSKYFIFSKLFLEIISFNVKGLFK